MNKDGALVTMQENPRWGKGVLYDPETQCFCNTGWLLCSLGVPEYLLAGRQAIIPDIPATVGLPRESRGTSNVFHLLATLVDDTDPDLWRAVMILNDAATSHENSVRATAYYFEHRNENRAVFYTASNMAQGD